MNSNYYIMEIVRLKKEAAALKFAVETVVRVPGEIENADKLVQLCTMLKSTQDLIGYYEAEKGVALAKEQAAESAGNA